MEQVDKSFPLDLDWQHLNAHTVGYCLHSLKAQFSIYFETAFVFDLQGTLAACYVPKRTKKKYSSEACSTVPTSFCLYQQMTKAGKHNFDPQSHNNNHKYLTSAYSS